MIPFVDCSFEGCGRKVKARGLCEPHYNQFRRGKELKPLRVRSHEVDGNKLCTTCMEWKPVEDFDRKLTGRHTKCRPCKKSLRLNYCYGIDTVGWENLFDLQDRRCKICRRADPGNRPWATDHNHACCPGEATCGKCVRGILCSDCNMALGKLENHLESAIAYILEYQ
jgi:hypothetical protein